MRTGPTEQQCSEPEKQDAGNCWLKDEMQLSSAASDPVFIIQDVSINDYPVEDSGTSELNDVENSVLFTEHQISLFNELVGNGFLLASNPDTKSAHVEDVAPSDPYHKHPVRQNQQYISPHRVLHEHPSSSCFPDDTIFDPIRPCRGAPGKAPPPRRFYAFWWRNVVRAAYDAERAARLARARTGGVS